MRQLLEASLEIDNIVMHLFCWYCCLSLLLLMMLLLLWVFSFFIDQSGDCFLCSVWQGLFFSFFLSLVYRPTEWRWDVFQCILNSGVLGEGWYFSRSTYEEKKMHPWSFYGCKVTDWSTVTLTFNFPPGVLACDLEGAHFSQERRLDLSMTIIERNHFAFRHRSLKAATDDGYRCTLVSNTAPYYCRRHRMQFPSRCLKHISEVACDLRNNHTPTNASETCPNQFQTGSSKPLESIL